MYVILSICLAVRVICTVGLRSFRTSSRIVHFVEDALDATDLRACHPLFLEAS